MSHVLMHSVKREIKENLTLAVPLISSQLIYACSGFIGTVFIAQLGQDALAASILVSAIWSTLTIMFFGILNSVSVLVSHQYGSGEKTLISTIMGQAFWLGLAICIVMILILLTMPMFLHWSHQPAQVNAYATQYMNALMWTVPALVLLIIYEQFLAGINRAKIVLRISLLVVPIEIPIIYVLIFGKLGFPALGVAGIGYGFAITYTITSLFMTFYLLRRKGYAAFGIFKRLKEFNYVWVRELIRVGVPMGLMHMIEVGTFGIVAFWIAQFGTTLLAAHQIAIQFLGFFITIVFAMAQAVTVRVGNAVGKLDLLGVRYAIYVGMLLNFCCVIVIAAVFNLFPETLIKMELSSNDNSSLLHDASTLLGICGILILFDNFRIIGFGALRGLKDTKFPVLASLVAFGLVGLGVAYLLGFYANMKANGIWIGLTCGIAFGALVIFIRIQWLLRRIDLESVREVK